MGMTLGIGNGLSHPLPHHFFIHPVKVAQSVSLLPSLIARGTPALGTFTQVGGAGGAVLVHFDLLDLVLSHV